MLAPLHVYLLLGESSYSLLFLRELKNMSTRGLPFIVSLLKRTKEGKRKGEKRCMNPSRRSKKRKRGTSPLFLYAIEEDREPTFFSLPILWHQERIRGEGVPYPISVFLLCNKKSRVPIIFSTYFLQSKISSITPFFYS